MWTNRRLIYAKHAQLPTPFYYKGELKMYYSARDNENRSYISFFNLNPDTFEVIYDHEKPILSYGSPGRFYDSGVMPSCVVLEDNTLYLFYTGWSRSVTVPYQQAIGIALSRDGVNFSPLSGPIIGRSIDDPYIVNSANVVYHKDFHPERDGIGPKYKMIYSSGRCWSGDKPIYGLKCACTSNLWEWTNKTFLVGSNDEILSRSTLFNDYLLYSSKKVDTNYRMESYNIKTGERSFSGKMVLMPSKDGWDSEMICYPYVWEYNRKTYMFYNGNGYGKTGIGVVEWTN